MGLTVPQNPGGCKERGTGEGGHTVYMGAIHSTLCTVRHIDNLDNKKLREMGSIHFFGPYNFEGPISVFFAHSQAPQE